MKRYTWGHTFTLRARVDEDGKPSPHARNITGPGAIIWLPDTEAARLRADFGVNALHNSPLESDPIPMGAGTSPSQGVAPRPATGYAGGDATESVVKPDAFDDLDDLTKSELWKLAKGDAAHGEGLTYQSATSDDLRAFIREQRAEG